jgi:RNA polymerase sigma-70 factor, ECF subfamily
MGNQQRPANSMARAPGLTTEARRNLTDLPLDAVGDAALLGALVNGSHRAATMIWHRHSAVVRRMLCRSLGPDQELDDLVQDVFLGLLKSAHKLEDPNSLKAYLISIAFRTAAMEIRRRKVRRWVTLTSTGELPDTPALLHAHLDDARALRALYRILDTISARDRLVFVARYIEGMQIEETAEALQLSKATVWRTGKATLQRVVDQAQREPALASYVERTLKDKAQ